jgi:hypothetical protein
MVNPISTYSTTPWLLPNNDVGEPQLVAAETEERDNYINLLDPKSVQYQHGKKIRVPNDVLIVDGHGNCAVENVSSGNIFDDRNGIKLRKRLSAPELIKLIKEKTEGKDFKLIVFLSCFGAQLNQIRDVVKELGIPALAATKKVFVGKNGEIAVADTQRLTLPNGKPAEYDTIEKLGYFKLLKLVGEGKTSKVVESGFGYCHIKDLVDCLPK